MGSSDRAARQAQAAEDQRRRDVLATQHRIEDIYGAPGREADIQSIIAATRSWLNRDLSQKNATAGRQLKFALARNGQTQGSVDVDQHRQLGQDYLKAALEVERRAQSAGTSLRQADQQSKLNLFSQAQAGLDMTTAARNAAESMRSNIDYAKSQAQQDGIGDAFGNLGDIYTASKKAAGERNAERYQYGTFYAPTGASGSPWG